MRQQRLLALCLATSALALSACSDLDVDLRDLGRGFDTSDAVKIQAAPRPKPDDRGIISYPGYQVAVAQRNDTVTALAGRIGLPPQEIARYNGVPVNAVLNRGEVLALPRRVAEPSPATGAISTGPIRPAETVDVTALASGAIDRADSTISPAAQPKGQTGAEPVRHKVERGETAFSVARLYGVSVRDLADWNGLNSELALREGQFLLIPVAVAPKARPQTTAAVKPGTGSPTPTPPSATAPLPKESPTQTTAAAPATGTPPSPELGKEATSATATAKFVRPVAGKVIRDFKKKKNDGIDIAAAAGTPVKAADAGTVAAITEDTDKVPIVVLRHAGGLLTVYANVDSVAVKKGDKVKRGQAIAKVRAGSPSFMHFEVREGLEAVDPASYLN